MKMDTTVATRRDYAMTSTACRHCKNGVAHYCVVAGKDIAAVAAKDGISSSGG